jgi:regulator of protease activity HflC (stomatin/prohibitin superfamily)
MGSEEAYSLHRPAEEPTTEAIGQALAAAAALGERMVAEAGERAEALRTDAEAEAARLLADARAEVARLEREADELRSFLASATNEFVATAREALAHLDELERPGGSGTPSDVVAEG